MRAEVGSALYNRIGELQQSFYKKNKKFFFYGWIIHRYYTKQELSETTLLHLDITSTFEPAGEICGTLYDKSSVCPYCKVGRKQTTDLFLDLRKMPKNKDIARTIADEWVISQRLAQLFLEHQITGFELRPVRHKAYYMGDSVDPRQLETGRNLIKLAEEQGMPLSGLGILGMDKSTRAGSVSPTNGSRVCIETSCKREAHCEKISTMVPADRDFKANYSKQPDSFWHRSI